MRITFRLTLTSILLTMLVATVAAIADWTGSFPMTSK